VLSAEPTSTTTETSTWPWWLLAAGLIAIDVGTALLIAKRRRRNSWNAQLMSAIGEIVWFARQLIPQLQRDGSRDQLAGAWQVTRDRVSTLEDTLTGFHSTAPTEARLRGPATCETQCGKRGRASTRQPKPAGRLSTSRRPQTNSAPPEQHSNQRWSTANLGTGRLTAIHSPHQTGLANGPH